MYKTTTGPLERGEARVAWLFMLPALAAVLLIAIFPLAWTVWESLHLHDLRMPWLGYRFVGLANYAEALRTPRFWDSIWHTAFFTACSVSLELVLGLVLALALNRAYRGRGLVRTAVLLPWAIPTVVAALLWQFMFDSQAGIVNALSDRHRHDEPAPAVGMVHRCARRLGAGDSGRRVAHDAAGYAAAFGGAAEH